MKLVFVAIPSKGTVVDGALRKEFLMKLAELHENNPGITFVSPMVQDYQILEFLSVEPIWEELGKHCRCLIERSDEVWVLMYEGWKESTGVTAEVAHAKQHGKPVYYWIV